MTDIVPETTEAVVRTPPPDDRDEPCAPLHGAPLPEAAVDQGAAEAATRKLPRNPAQQSDSADR